MKHIWGCVVAVGALSLVAAPSPADADDVLRIGVIESLSGPQATTGRLFRNATHFVVEQMNANGALDGLTVEVTDYDNRGEPGTAADRVRDAASDGMHIIVQGASSAIAGQITQDVLRHNTRNPGEELLYLNMGAEALELTGDNCHFFHFRFTTTAPVRVGALVRGMNESGELGERVYSLNQDYSWGRDMEAAIQDFAEEGGYEVVGSTLHDTNRIQDFAPYVQRIRDSGADTVITGNWSNDLLFLMDAAAQADLDVRFATAFLDQIGNIAAAGDTALGHYLAGPFNIEAGGDAGIAFAEEYRDAVGNYPVYVEPQTVNGMRMLEAALEAVVANGGDPLDTSAIALALEEAEIETPLGPLTMRAEDHQAILPVAVSRLSHDSEFPVDDTDMGFEPIMVLSGEEAAAPAQESCQMEHPS